MSSAHKLLVSLVSFQGFLIKLELLLIKLLLLFGKINYLPYLFNQTGSCLLRTVDIRLTLQCIRLTDATFAEKYVLTTSTAGRRLPPFSNSTTHFTQCPWDFLLDYHFSILNNWHLNYKIWRYHMVKDSFIMNSQLEEGISSKMSLSNNLQTSKFLL